MNRHEVDVAIVGGGPAGLSTAAELRRLGVKRVVVIERETEAGGIPRHCSHPTFGLLDTGRPMNGPTYARRLVARTQRAGAQIRPNTTALEIGANGERFVVTTSPSGLERWEARAIVLASGCRERPMSARLIPGTRAAGVLTTGQLQRLQYEHGREIGSHAVVLGDEHVSISAIMTLLHSGVRVVALVSPSRKHQTPSSLRRLVTGFRSVPTLLGHNIVETMGKGRLSGVIVADADGTQKEIPCDTLVVTGDWVAEGSLAISSGASSDTSVGGRPIVDPSGQTSSSGLFSVGGVVRPGETSYQAVKTGRLVAKSVSDFVGGHLNRDQARKQLSYTPPIRWISPQVYYGSQSEQVLVRVDRYVKGSEIVATSEGRIINRLRVRQMFPGQTYALDRSWCESIIAESSPKLELSIEVAT